MNLFDKVKIRNMEAANHFVRSATYEGKATEDGYPTKETRQIYERLAKGGVGVIITSYTYITDYEQPQKNQLGIYSDKMIAAYKELTDVIHQYDSKIVMQIVHGSSWGQGYPERARILGPSVVKHPTSGLISEQMTKEDIVQTIKYFADAAGRVKAAGFDGVQIHCAHSYLLSHFISPLFNMRTDEYGGSVENRIRIVREIYQAIRRIVGTDYPVWIKMNSTDEVPGGLVVEDFLEMAKLLADDGIDCIEVSGDKWSTHKTDERAYYKEGAMRLSKLVHTPVILTGGLRELSDLESIYKNSNVALFGFARPFIKNPEFLKTLYR